MRITLTDAQGPRLWRLLPYALPLMLLLASIFGPLVGGNAVLVAGGAAAVFNLVGAIGSRRRKPRPAELTVGPGFVDVQKAGIRNQRIRAADVTGASSARNSEGILLTIDHRGRDQPITIHVANDADADRIRQALGIGHGGFGTLSWRVQRSAAPFTGRVVATIGTLLAMMLGVAAGWEAVAVGSPLLAMMVSMGSLIGFLGLVGKAEDPSIVMTPEGLRLRTHQGWFALPYDAIQHVEDHPRAVVFTVPAPYHTVAVERSSTVTGGLTDGERRSMIAQILAASARARGLGPQKNDVTGRVDVLRRQGESARDWLVRLDMAGQMLSAGPGYRGQTLDVEDLWTVLEDPEAEPELRAAAARVLRHASNLETRVRISAAVAAVRDESVSRRLRIAVRDDLEEASQELAFLDANESRLVGQQRR